MFYQDFIQCVYEQGSEKIKAFKIEESCSTEQVPQEVLRILPALIELLEKNLPFVSSSEVVFLFGLQPCAVSIHSDFPLRFNRVFDKKNSFKHLCCVLQYFLASKKSLDQDRSWQKTQTLAIDFTTGFLMDNEYYFAKVFDLPSQGLVYGSLQPSELNAIWARISKK